MSKLVKLFCVASVFSGVLFSLVISINSEDIETIAPSLWESTWRENPENLSRAYTDDQVAIYFDPNVEDSDSITSDPFTLFSTAWKYLKKTYGPFGPDLLLYIALRNGSQIEPESNGISCISSNEKSINDQKFEPNRVIDCNLESVIFNESNKLTISQNSLNNVLLEIGKMSLKLNKGYGNWPAKDISGWTMASILIYDVFLSEGNLKQAENWRREKMEESFKGIYWFRDFHLPVYNSYEGKVVLNTFLEILQENWPKANGDYREQLSLGDFVHFWSGAAGGDLKPLAMKAFMNWTDNTEYELFQAQTFFPRIKYGEKAKIIEKVQEESISAGNTNGIFTSILFLGWIFTNLIL